LAVVYCLLAVVYCLLAIGCCLLPIGYCLLPQSLQFVFQSLCWHWPVPQSLHLEGKSAEALKQGQAVEHCHSIRPLATS
jgi:hypothetical protein